MPESMKQPNEIEIDTIKNGVARLLCRWDIISTVRGGYTYYQYYESIINWTLPDYYVDGTTQVKISTREDVNAYILANLLEIMSFAKGSKLTL